MTLTIRALFLDLGGVLLTNGWDRSMRERAADKFHLDLADMDERHHLTFDTYEEGKLSLDEYLSRVVFCQARPFSKEEFIDFMFAQSQPHSEVIDLVRRLKSKFGLKLAAVSNEGRELALYRIKKYALDDFIDFFIVSSFVHFRKPDHDIFGVALDIAQVEPSQVVYIEDRPLFVQVAQELGMHGIRHTDIQSTRERLVGFDLSVS